MGGPCTIRMHIACEIVSRGFDIDEWENLDPSEFRKDMEDREKVLK